MKQYLGNYLGLCVNNDDPERRGRVQIFIPHIMPALFKDWNEAGEDIQLLCVGDNIPQSLPGYIVDKLKKILPWSECASPILGISSPGSLIENNFNQSPIVGAVTAPGGGTINGASGGGDGGNWGGSLDKLSQIMPVGAWSPSSQKRSRQSTASGGISDHWDGKNNAYAVDLGLNSSFAGDSNKATQTAIQIVNNVRAQRGEAPVASWDAYRGKYYTATTPDGYRVQVIWDSYVGGNHTDHIHVGVENVGGRAAPQLFTQSQASGLSLNQNPYEYTSLGGQAATFNSHQSKNPNDFGQGGLYASWAKPTIEAQGGTSANFATGQAPTLGGAPATQASGQQIPVSTSVGAGSTKLSQDRIARFGGEINTNKEQILSRITALAVGSEVGTNSVAQQAFIETIINRAYFSNRSLNTILYESGYGFKGTQTAIPSTTIRTAFQNVMQGSNITNLATDAGYNKPNSGRGVGGLFVTGMQSKDYVITGVMDIRTGQFVTDQALLNRLYTQGDITGRYEFFVRQSRSTSAADIEQYAQTNGIQPGSADAVASSMVMNTDTGGSSAVLNTNNMAKGVFTYPAAGALLWVFFREGNPLFPVYFAANYGEREWQSAFRQGSDAPGYKPAPKKENPIVSTGTVINWGVGGIRVEDTTDPNNPTNNQKSVMLFGNDGSNMFFNDGYHQIFSKFNRRDQVEGNRYHTTLGVKEEIVQSDSNAIVMGDEIIKVGNITPDSINAVNRIHDIIKDIMSPLTESNGPQRSAPPAANNKYTRKAYERYKNNFNVPEGPYTIPAKDILDNLIKKGGGVVPPTPQPPEVNPIKEEQIIPPTPPAQ